MRSFFSKVSAVVLTLLVAALPAGAEVPPKPGLKFGQSTFDFGTVIQGSKVIHDFEFTNTGTADLVIQRVVPACGCTAAAADSAPVAPGKTGKIHVEFDTAGFAGEKLKTVRIYTNDLDNPTPMLTIKGTVQPDITIEPARISFEDIARDAAEGDRKAEFTVKVREGSGLKIAGAQSLSKFLAVKDLSTGEQQRKIEVSVDPSAPLGELRERILVNLTGSRNQSVNVPVYAMVRGNLQLKPPMLSFGVIDGAEPLVRSVKLENSGKEPVNILSVSSNNPAVTAESSAIQPGKLYVIKVSVDPTKVRHDLRAALDVKSDAKNEGALSLNVYGILPPKTR